MQNFSICYPGLRGNHAPEIVQNLAEESRSPSPKGSAGSAPGRDTSLIKVSRKYSLIVKKTYGKNPIIGVMSFFMRRCSTIKSFSQHFFTVQFHSLIFLEVKFAGPAVYQHFYVLYYYLLKHKNYKGIFRIFSS